MTGEFEPTSAEKAVHEVKVIDAEQIQTMGFQQLDEVLEQQLNLRVNQDPSLGAGLTMQGIGGNNVQIMIDGVPVIGRLDGNIDISQLPLYNVERVEIVQGAMSNRYGTNAAGGVINLITKKNDGAEWSVTTQNQWENVGLLSNTLGLSGRLGRVLLSGSVFRYKSQLFSDDSLRSSQSMWNPKEQVGGDAQFKYYGKKSLEFGISVRYFDELVRDLGEVKRPQFEPYSFDQYFYTRRIDPRAHLKFDMGRNHKFNSVTAFNLYDRVSENRRIDFENDSNYVLDDGQDTSKFTTLLNRTIVTESGALDGLVQTDAASSSGNSGGPLVNALGQVVGINTAVARGSATTAASNIGFAISAEEALPILESLRQQAGGSPRQEGFLGVGLDDRTDGGLGALITDVRADTPADDAGIESGDIVIAIDGSPVEGVAGLIAAIRDLEPGDSTEITLRRGDRVLDLLVVLTSRPDS